MARRNEHSREAIHDMALDAAEAIAASEGYPGLSARKVAKAIGYTVGTLYLVFENLDDLVLQVNARTLDALYERLVRQRPESEQPEDVLLALAYAYIAYAEAESPRWNMLFESVYGKDGNLPEWYQQKLGRVFWLVEGALRPLRLKEGEEVGMARVLWASVHGICTLSIRQRLELAGGLSVEAMAKMLICNFLRGARATELPHLEHSG